MRAAICGEAQGMMGRDRQLTIAAVEVAPVTTLTVIKSSETETLDCR